MSEMNTNLGVNPLEDTSSDAALAYAKDRRENIRIFVRTSPEYYIAKFDKIGASARFTATFNAMAGLFGPILFGARGLWSWALPFLILEALAFVQIARGLFGDLAADAMVRIASIEGTLALRKQQLASAIENNSEKVDVYERTVDSLEANIGGIRVEAEAMAAEGPSIALTGLVILVVVKLVQSLVANWALEARFSDWLSDRSIRSGMPKPQIIFSAVFMILIVAIAMLHYSFPGRFSLLNSFPTKPEIRLVSIDRVEAFFNWAVLNGEALFDAITYFIRLVLDALELIFVSTPSIVVASLIILLTVAHSRCSYGDIFWRFSRLYGIARVLGQSDDNFGFVRYSRLLVDHNWYSPWHVRCASSSVLFLHPADYGFHANNAGLRLYDPRHRLFWHGQTSSSCHDNDFWRYSGRTLDCARPARSSRKRARSGNQFRREQMVLAHQSRLT